MVKHGIIDRSGVASMTVQGLIESKFLSGVIGETRIIYARYGVNKTTLRKLLKKETMLTKPNSFGTEEKVTVKKLNKLLKKEGR